MVSKRFSSKVYININSDIVIPKLTEIINTARQSNAAAVKRLGAGDGIFTYSKNDTLIDVPELSLSKTDAASTDTQ